MNKRENILRAVRFESPAYIPMEFHINPACWHAYPHDALWELMVSHPFLFPDFEPPTQPYAPPFDHHQRADIPYTDDWGCVWETSENGITGAVTQHPLADWTFFEGFTPPDPAFSDGLGPIDWHQISQSLQQCRLDGHLAQSSLRHGHTFLRLQDLRGYQNLIFDMADANPRLLILIEMVEVFNRGLVQRYIEAGAEWIGFPDDLGMQVGPMVSPSHFRTFIKPGYQRLMHAAREAGCVVHMHSDGDLHTLMEDLIDSRVEVINMQDQVNGIDWIAANVAGRICIELDIDRQTITRFGSPAEIDALIREEVEKLGNKQGGLMMIYGLYPGVPLENAKAVMDAMTNYAPLH